MEISFSPQKLKEEQETLFKAVEKTKKVLHKLGGEIFDASMKDIVFGGVGDKISIHLESLEKYTTALERRSMGVVDNLDDEDNKNYNIFHNFYLESNKLNKMVYELIGIIAKIKKISGDINLKNLQNFSQKTINI